MEKIDLKDKKILYELDIDSRQSFRNIGRKNGLSKDIVASRVKKLKENALETMYNDLNKENKRGLVLVCFYSPSIVS